MFTVFARSFCCAVLVTAATAVGAEEVFRVCADPNNLPFSDRQGAGFENKIAEMFARELGEGVEYTWFPQRIGFIRNTLQAKLPDKDVYKCDVVMGVPAGYELTATTKPYYRSTYVLIYAKNRGWDDLSAAEDLTTLPPERKQKLRIGVFDRTPGTNWVLNNGLIEQSVTYQSMSGDPAINPAQLLDSELKKGGIDMAIVWGPFAGYLVSANPPGTFAWIPLRSAPGMKFDYPIAMGVRFGEKERKEQLDALIDAKAREIQTILVKFHVPLLGENGEVMTPPSL